MVYLLKFAIKFVVEIFIGMAILIFIAFVALLALAIHDSKYEFIMEEDENGNWVEYPVNLPCMEDVDDYYIKHWNEQNRKYKKYLREQKIKKFKKFFNL